jgi:L-alanine-DL-glutamate epimerase-like enolase superfamily enzyme
MGEQRRVAGVQTSAWRVPLRRPWGPEVNHVHLVVAEVADDTGARGTGFSWTPQIGAMAIHAMVRDDVMPAVVDGPTDPFVVWDRLWWHLHEAGGGGITTMAIAAVDIALWDLAGQVSGRSLVDLLGRRRDRAPVYGSGVNFHYPLDELEAQVQRWVAAGCSAVKVKVGHPDLDEDLERVAAVRRVIGPERRLMVDANQRWELDAAIRAAKALEAFEPAWLEEPILADDLAAHVELRRATSIPIAIGESMYTAHQFADAVGRGACDIVQPNVVRVGGITPFLRIAERARADGAVVAPHLLPDLSGQLALCLPDETMVEDVEDASFARLGVLAGDAPVRIDGGWLTSDTGPGHGLAFDLADNPNVERLA